MESLNRDTLAGAVLKAFREQFSDDTIGESTTIKSLPFDSLDFVEIAFLIEENAGVPLEFSEALYEVEPTDVGNLINSLWEHYTEEMVG